MTADVSAAQPERAVGPATRPPEVVRQSPAKVAELPRPPEHRAASTPGRDAGVPVMELKPVVQVPAPQPPAPQPLAAQSPAPQPSRAAEAMQAIVNDPAVKKAMEVFNARIVHVEPRRK